MSDSLPGSPELTLWVAELGLSITDEAVLTGGEWLSDTHISAANRLLRTQFPSQNGLQDTCVLQQKGTWSSNPDRFVQILFIHPGHWVCISNKYSSVGSVDLFDSLHTIPVEDDSIVQQVCSVLQSTESAITINVINVEGQAGADGCGLFAIAMAYDLCAEIDPISKVYTQGEMRSHLCSCFNSKKIKTFPSTDRHITARILHQITVEIHCICRMPELSKRMVCCDCCGLWYHEGCIPIPKEVLLDQNDEVFWECPQCQKGIYNCAQLCPHDVQDIVLKQSFDQVYCNVSFVCSKVTHAWSKCSVHCNSA